MNCLRVDREQAAWLADQPVFTWGIGGSDIAFPECLYRSTYLGPALFLDEPAVGTRDHDIRPRLAKEVELRQQLTPEIMLEAFREHFDKAVREGAPASFINGLRARNDLDLGSLHFSQGNLYSWETMIASAAWQLTAEPERGPCAIVFEPPGRLGSRRTIPEMNMSYGCQLPPEDPENLSSIIVGFLRGAARTSGKDWGISIYGAVDRADAPRLLTRAYDLGAKYFFFWDNYQLACVPFEECLELTKHLQAHAQISPKRDFGLLGRAAEVAILLPPGYDLGHTHMGRGNLWGLGELNLERTNAHGVTYRQVMSNFFTEIERCRRSAIPFDLLWDLNGLRLEGYREIVRVREDGTVLITTGAGQTVLPRARIPERPPGQPPRMNVGITIPADPLPQNLVASSQVIPGSAEVFYTTGADRNGLHHNAQVLWELYGPEAWEYHMAPPPGADPVDKSSGKVEARFRLERPGHYRLRVATTDLAGRSTVVWKEFDLNR